MILNFLFLIKFLPGMAKVQEQYHNVSLFPPEFPSNIPRRSAFVCLTKLFYIQACLLKYKEMVKGMLLGMMELKPSNKACILKPILLKNQAPELPKGFQDNHNLSLS